MKKNKRFFKELITEMFFEETKMVPLWHRWENPILKLLFLMLLLTIHRVI